MVSAKNSHFGWYCPLSVHRNWDLTKCVPSLPLYNAGSKALVSVEGFLFLEPAICFAPSAGSDLVAPAIVTAVVEVDGSAVRQ